MVGLRSRSVGVVLGIAALLLSAGLAAAAEHSAPQPAAAPAGRVAVTVAGGPMAVADEVVEAVRASAAVSRADRVAGPNRFATAVELSRSRFGSGVPVAFVAAGADFPDALAAAPMAAHARGPLLFTARATLPAATRAELARLQPGRIVVVGGTAAVSADVADELEGLTAGTVTRLGGANRHATAAAISASFVEAGTDVVFLARADSFADALSGAPAAALASTSVLLVRPDGLPAPTVQELQRLAPSSVVALGGPAAIPPSVTEEATALTGAPVTRLGGADRFATAAAVSAATFPDGSRHAYLVSGADYPDGLAAGAVAGLPAEVAGAASGIVTGYEGQAPVLLARPSGLPHASQQEIDRLAQDPGPRPAPGTDDEPPVAHEQAVTTLEDEAIGVTLTGRGTDPALLEFNVATSPAHGTLGAVGEPDCGAGDCSAQVTYTPDADYFGSDSFTFTVDDGSATSEPATVTIDVTPVNDPPSFVLPDEPDQTVLEDAGPQTVAGFVTEVSPGPANEADQTVALEVTNDDNPLFSAQPAIDPATGDLTYTPADDAFGQATVTVVATDDGGTAHGGVDTSAPQAFTITVLPVNDPPSFVLPDEPDQTAAHNAGPQTVAGFASDVSAGPANEADQTVTFTVTADDTALFSAQPAIDADSGDLTYTPALESGGTATVTVAASDDGGTANGGVDTSAPQEFTITVIPPNAAPTLQNHDFTAHANTLLHVDAAPAASGPHLFTAASLLDGATDADSPDEDLTAAVHPASVTPGAKVSVEEDGTFTYVPPPGFVGEDTFTYVVSDNHADDPQTTEASVTVTVEGPVVWYVDNTADASAADGTSTHPHASLTPLGDASRAGDVVFVHAGDGDTTGGLGLAAGQRVWGAPHGLTVGGRTLAEPAGDAPILSGGVTLAADADVQGVTLTGGGQGAALSGTDVGAATVGTDTPVAVDNPAGGGLALSGGNPTVTLASLVSGGGAHGIALSDLAGTVTVHGGAITGAATAGVAVDGGTVAASIAADVDQTTDAPAVHVTGHATGTVEFTGDVTATDGAGLRFDDAGGAYTFSGPTTLDGGAAGVAITDGSSGTFDFGPDTRITDPSGNAFAVSGGSPTVTYRGDLTKSGAGDGRLVSVTGRTGGDVRFEDGALQATNTGTTPGIHVRDNSGGTLTFANPVKTLETGANPAVTLANNAGAAVTFSGGGLVLTATGGDGLTAAGGGTVTVTGSGNRIQTTTGTALRVADTGIGAGNLVFESLDAGTGGAGPVSGIVLDGTGSAGGLVVSGDGTTPGSGGTIQRTTGDAVSLTGATGVDLRHLDVERAAGSGIRGHQVAGLTLTGVNVRRSGDTGLVRSGVHLTELRGSNAIVGGEVSGSRRNNVHVHNTSGTLAALALTDCTVNDIVDSPDGNMGVFVQAESTAVMSASVSGCELSGNRTIAVRGDTAGSSRLDLEVTGNTIVAGSNGNPQGNQGIEVSTSATSQLTFAIEGNRVGTPDGTTASPLISTGINAFAGNTSTLVGTVRDNVVRNAGQGSGFGIRVYQDQQSVVRANVAGNTVSHVAWDYGILVDGAGDAGGPGGAVDIAVTGNTANVADTALDAIRVQFRRQAVGCARISGNTTATAGDFFEGLFVRRANTATFNLEGLAPGPQSPEAAHAALSAANPGAHTTGTSPATGGTPFTGVAAGTCAVPS